MNIILLSERSLGCQRHLRHETLGLATRVGISRDVLRGPREYRTSDMGGFTWVLIFLKATASHAHPNQHDYLSIYDYLTVQHPTTVSALYHIHSIHMKMIILVATVAGVVSGSWCFAFSRAVNKVEKMFCMSKLMAVMFYLISWL